MTQMYIIIEKSTQKAWHLKEKTQIGRLINISTRTLDRNIHKLPKEWNGFTVYTSENNSCKSLRGGNWRGL